MTLECYSTDWNDMRCDIFWSGQTSLHPMLSHVGLPTVLYLVCLKTNLANAVYTLH